MRYVDADVLMEHLKRKEAEPATRNYTEGFNDALMRCRSMVHSAPTVDAEPVKHGRWFLERDPNGNPYCFHCSCCDSDYHHIGVTSATKYCPNCGAKMDGKEE